MRHCTPDELIDVVEGVRTAASLPHLAACAGCQQQLREVGGMLAEVRAVPVPEPSAAQWARLSARVRDAVASEVEPAPTHWWHSWSGRAWLIPAAAILTLAVLLPRAHRSEPGVPSSAVLPSTAAVGGANTTAVIQPPADDTREDPSLGLMFDLAAAIDLDSDPAPVLAMGPGILDEAVGDLSPDEQHELARLIKEAIERPGA
jgi:hypothetical protein